MQNYTLATAGSRTAGIAGTNRTQISNYVHKLNKGLDDA
jgi:hypothetical protein